MINIDFHGFGKRWFCVHFFNGRIQGVSSNCYKSAADAEAECYAFFPKSLKTLEEHIDYINKNDISEAIIIGETEFY